MRLICLGLGGLFLLAAAAAVTYELTMSDGGGGLQLLPLGQVWFDVDAGSLNLLQAVVERYISEALWDPVILTVLYWPAILVFLVPGVLLVLIGLMIRRGRYSRR